jgi:hypothetical protein
MKVFNYGFEGCSIIHQYLSLLRAIDNGGLQLAILDLSAAQLEEEWVYDRLSRYYPYYWRNDTIMNIIDDVEGRDMRFLMCSSLIQYNSQLFNLFIKDKQYKGYSPLPYTGTPFIAINSNEEDVPSDINKMEKSICSIAKKYLIKMQEECDKNDIKLVVCISPSLFPSDGNIEILCKKYDIECWNMCGSVDNPLYFSNETHLNEKGAEAFTGLLVNRIMKELPSFKTEE